MTADNRANEPTDEREALMEAMERGEKVRQAAWSAYGQEPDGEGTKPYSDNWYRAEALMAAGFSRATAPDAATAAVNRVRAAVEKHKHWNEGCGWDVPTIEVLTALDGAPEPEVAEHDYAIKYLGNDKHFRKVVSLEDARKLADTALGDVIMHRIKSRQLPAGPWLPVEGEKP